MIIRVSQNEIFLILFCAAYPLVGSSFQSPQKKFQRYRPINEILQAIFVFGFMIMGKELLADLNLTIFKIWLDTRPKMEMHDPNVYPTILGGVSRGFWSPFLAVGAQIAIYLITLTF